MGEVKKDIQWALNCRGKTEEKLKSQIDAVIIFALDKGLPEDDADLHQLRKRRAKLDEVVDHPTREEIVGLDPSSTPWAEGALSEKAMVGDTDEIVLAVAAYVGAKLDPVLQSPDLITKLWSAVDVDKDVTLNGSEVREFVRVYFSCPRVSSVLSQRLAAVIGSELVKVPGAPCWNVPHDDSCPCPQSHEKAIEDLKVQCHLAACAGIRILARRLPEIAEDLWSGLDLDGSGEVTGAEFVQLIDKVLDQKLDMPILAWAKERVMEVIESGGLHAKTGPEALDLVRAKRSASRKKQKKSGGFREEEDDRDREDICSACKAQDCSIQ